VRTYPSFAVCRIPDHPSIRSVPLLTKRGYAESCRTIVSASRHFAAQIKQRFPTDLYVLGDPKISVVAFASRDPARLNIHAVGDAMGKKGWHLNGLANPAALHMAFTVGHFSSACF
jgi:sphinganine-1-phosphate aldolase